MTRGRVQLFPCPECGLTCKLEPGENRSALSHEVPVCETYRAHKGREMKFLQLAQAAHVATQIKPGNE